MSARSLAGALARNGSSAAPPTNWAWRWALATFVVLIVGVVGVFLWTMNHNSPRMVMERWAEREVGEGRACLLSQDWAHVDTDSGLVVVRCAQTIYCGEPPDVWASPSGGADRIDGWNSAVRRHLAAGDADGPRFRDHITTLGAVRESFRHDAAVAVRLPIPGVATIGEVEVKWWGSTVIVRRRGAEKWLQPVGGAPVEPRLDVDAIDVAMLTADAGRSLWVRVASKTGQDLWYFVIDLATGTHLYTFDARG
jgi:hypothetical protein